MGVEKWKKQSYRKIKKQCVTAGKLWDDPLFPPNDNSLALTKSTYENVVWKRPSVSHISFMNESLEILTGKSPSGTVQQSQIVCGESKFERCDSGKSWQLLVCGGLLGISYSQTLVERLTPYTKMVHVPSKILLCRGCA